MTAQTFASKLIFKTLIAISVLAFGLIALTSTAHANGGKNDECEDAQVSSYESGGGSEMSYNASDGKVIDGVCIKSGNNMFGDKHSESLGNGTYEDGCYIVEGVGTSNLTVKRVKDGPNCQGLSHLDIFTSDSNDDECTVDCDKDDECQDGDDCGRGGDDECTENCDEEKEEECTENCDQDDDNDDGCTENCGGGDDNDDNGGTGGEVLGTSTTVLAATGQTNKTLFAAILAISLVTLQGIYFYKRFTFRSVR